MVKRSGPITICVINLKGGVGKSTISALLCRHAYFYKNLDVLAVDLDPQANLSQALMREKGYTCFLNEKRPSIVEVFNGYRPPSSTTLSASTLSPDDVVETISEN